MAQVEVIKPKSKLVPASSVKGYRPATDGFVGAPERRDPPTGFVLQTKSPGGYSVGMKTKAPGAIAKEHISPGPDRVPKARAKVIPGKANPRFILGVGRTIIPNDGISLGHANGGGI